MNPETHSSALPDATSPEDSEMSVSIETDAGLQMSYLVGLQITTLNRSREGRRRDVVFLDFMKNLTTWLEKEQESSSLLEITPVLLSASEGGFSKSGVRFTSMYDGPESP